MNNFILNYSFMKEILGHDAGLVMDNVKRGIFTISENGEILVQYTDSEAALFREHSRNEGWIRIEFIGINCGEG